MYVLVFANCRLARTKLEFWRFNPIYNYINNYLSIQPLNDVKFIDSIYDYSVIYSALKLGVFLIVEQDSQEYYVTTVQIM